MKYLFVIALLIYSGATLAWEKYPGTWSEVVKSDPVEAAKKAIGKGDDRLIIVADCFMGMPGYKGNKRPEKRPLVLGGTCDEIQGKESQNVHKEFKEWAREYNLYVQQHNQ